MEGNWVVLGVECGGLLNCVTVYISVFVVCFLCTAMLCLWKVIGLLWEWSVGVGVILLCDSLYIGIWCVFVMYSNVVFMEGNWVVMAVECGRGYCIL